MRQRFGSLLLAAIVLGFAGNGQPAQAQDDAVAEEEEQPARPRQAIFRSEQQFEQWFDQMVFNRTGSLEQTRKLFEDRLSRRIRELDNKYALTAAQTKKLELAGKRDIQRFFDSVQEKKAMLNRVRDDRERFLELYRDLRSWQVKTMAGNLFDEGSLLSKTLKTTLANDRFGRDAKDTYRSRVEWVVSLFDERLGLSEEQHRRLVTLIVEETPPLKRYGEYDGYAVMFQTSRLPEAKLARILNKGQMGVLHDRFLEAKTYEKVLIANGYLAGSESDRAQPGAVDGAKRKTVGARIVRPMPF
jgi:hypothetical protein